MELIRARKKDTDFIKKKLRANDLPTEDITSKIDDFYIAKEDLEIIGIAGLEICGNYGLARSILIEDRFRNQGLGKKLVFRLLDLARNKGVREVYILTTTAQNFFEKLKFEIVKREAVPEPIRKTTEFESLCPETAICMKKSI